MKWSLLLFALLTIASQTLSQNTLLKKIGINVKNCQASSVGNLNIKELWNAGCWSLKGDQCVFESPCKGKKKKKLNCKKNPGGFCIECDRCTCKKGKQQPCIHKLPCKDRLQRSLNQGCFIGQKRSCQYVYPCPQQVCNDGDKKCEECNNCICVGGNWACTKKVCESCPGDCWKKVGNRCKCNSICPGAKPISTPCNSGEIACNDCNRCRCFDNNEWQCLLNVCPTYCPRQCWGFSSKGCECKLNIDCGTRREPTGKCRNGDKTCFECNECVCLNRSWACTRLACTAKCDCWVFKGNSCGCQRLCK